MIRYMLVNDSKQDWTIDVKGTETILLYEMGTSTPPTKPEVYVPPDNKGSWSFTLPAGMIRGFAAIEAVDITIPNTRVITMYTQSNKDPWPPPPPPPPGYAKTPDFDTRFESFLLALGKKQKPVGIKVRVKQL